MPAGRSLTRARRARRNVAESKQWLNSPWMSSLIPTERITLSLSFSVIATRASTEEEEEDDDDNADDENGAALPPPTAAEESMRR